MATYYVRVDGSDSNDGSADDAAHAWLTLSKAITTVSLAGGHTINVGDGTYSESTAGVGYFNVTQHFTASITIQSTSGIAANVIIQGASHATLNTNLSSARHVNITNVTFTMRVPTSISALQMTGSSNNNIFTGCIINSGAGTTGSTAALKIATSGTLTLDHCSFVNCTITSTITANAGYAALISGATNTLVDTLSFTGCTIAAESGHALYFNTGPMSNITVDSCTINCYSQSGQGCRVAPNAAVASTSIVFSNNDISGWNGGMHIDGPITGLTISNGHYLSMDQVALRVGVDGQSGGALTGSISGVVAQSTSSHSLLIGAGCSNVTLDASEGYGGNFGLVIKQNTGTAVTNSTFLSGWHDANNAAILCKAAVNPSITGCLLSAFTSGSSCLWVTYDNVDSAKSSGVTFTGNRCLATGAATVFNWLGSNGDAGGGTVNGNTYTLGGTGDFGIVYGHSGQVDLPTVRSVGWAGYSPAGNSVTDTNSGTPAPVTVLGFRTG